MTGGAPSLLEARMTRLFPLVAASAAALTACAPTRIDFICLVEEPLCTLGDVLDDERPLATGVDITGVAMYQAVEKILMEDGALVDDPVRVAEGREAIFRVSVTPHADFEERTLTARLYLYQEDTLIDAAQADLDVRGPSDLADAGSTFNIAVLGTSIVAPLSWSVELVEVDDAVNAGGADGVAEWPIDGPAALETETTGPIRIYLVPVEYNGDNSGRLPDTSDTQLDTYRQYMYAHYPTTEVEIEVGEPFASSIRVSSGGGGWSELLTQVGALRSERGVDEDTYIYGAFNPADSEGAYGGGVYGLCNLAFTAADAWARACIGLGFPGGTIADTMVHEVGHAHGRNHSPCGGAAGPDPAYPHDNAIIGVRGYNLATDQFVDPTSTYDYMSYCGPTWTSDFTWEYTFLRVAAVNDLYNARAEPQPYMAAWVQSDGSIIWGEDQLLPGPPGGPRVEVELLDDKGRVLDTVDAWFNPYDHLPGGMVRLPMTDLPVDSVRIGGQTSPSRLSR